MYAVYLRLNFMMAACYYIYHLPTFHPAVGAFCTTFGPYQASPSWVLQGNCRCTFCEGNFPSATLECCCSTFSSTYKFTIGEDLNPNQWMGGWVHHANNENPGKTLLKKKRKPIQGIDYFGGEFSPFWDLKKKRIFCHTYFVLKNRQKTKFLFKNHHDCLQFERMLKIFLLPCFEYHQIWLNILWTMATSATSQSWIINKILQGWLKESGKKS